MNIYGNTSIKNKVGAVDGCVTCLSYDIRQQNFQRIVER